MHVSIRALRAAVLAATAAAALLPQATSAAAGSTARAVASCPGLAQGLGRVELSMNTPTTGWLLVACGAASLRLYRTHDGWRRWATLPALRGASRWGVQAWSTTPGMAILLMSTGGDGARGTQWRLVRVSAAGSVTPSPVRLPAFFGVLDMSFANGRNGALLATREAWAGGSLADFLVTTDGGRTWTLRDRRLADATTLLATGPRSAYVAGQTPVAGQPVLDRTRTAGRAWAPVALPLAAVARTSQITVASVRVQAGEVQVVVALSPGRVAVDALGPSGARRVATFRAPLRLNPLAFVAGRMMYAQGSRIVRGADGHWTTVAHGVQAFAVRGGTMWAALASGSSVTVRRVWP